MTRPLASQILAGELNIFPNIGRRLSLVELCPVMAVSQKSCVQVRLLVAEVCGEFVFSPDQFNKCHCHPLRHSVRNQIRASALRCVAFLETSRWQPYFRILDLTAVPLEVLRMQRFHKALGHMPSLERVRFSSFGWAYSTEYKSFVEALRSHGVSLNNIKHKSVLGQKRGRSAQFVQA